MRCFAILSSIALVLCVSSCATRPKVLESQEDYQREWERNDEAQLSYEAAASASNVHGGSVVVPRVPKSRSAGQRPGETVVKAPSHSSKAAAEYVAGPVDGNKIVLGPVVFEKGGSGTSSVGDAGNRIREIISQRIAKVDGLTLLDSPEDRFNIDSPRPDLARKGVRYVVKGVSSINKDGGVYKVFLRVVDTATGKVSMIVSGKNADPDVAAQQASERLVVKLNRAM